MATGVGLQITEDECVAAIVTDGGDADTSAEPLYITRESVLHMSDDGDTALGGTAPPGHTHSITGFVGAVGDPAGITVDAGEAYRAEDLVATAIFCLINLAADHLNGPAEFYATHPGDWPADHVRGLREALDYLGLRSVNLVSEADLPATDDPGVAADARGPARHAARAALASVLSTPAGSTPPDSAGAENSLESTDVLPALPAASEAAQAYSAAIPVAGPEPGPAPATPTKVAPAVPPEEPKRSRRTPLLIAAGAALAGVVIGGIVAAILLGNDTSPPEPASESGQADARTTSATTPPPSTEIPEPPVQQYTEVPEETTTTAPAPPPQPAESAPPTPTATTEESTTPPAPTRTTAPTTTERPKLGPVPGLQIPTDSDFGW
ncbi:hypothetical protein [Nocardia vermiculata]|uniref:Uncharacterized protein n=1 Tax=Nocardia vermiculata TaxID=257274 RepID=A0A846Y746_9NOCA|nr:hypothetical protein [Nocardia vermiculata]NKY52509.1 hypothetical protein [Nocardia vermiculata]